MVTVKELAHEPFNDPEALYATRPAAMAEVRDQGLSMIMAFTGFSDAGQAVGQVSTELLEHLSAEPVAVFDVDQLIDYRSRRPTINFVVDHLEGYQRPQLVLYRLNDGLGNPFLFLTGNEPDLQWERFASAVVNLTDRLGVHNVAWAHAVPMPVPHTRPLGASVHGSVPNALGLENAWKMSVQIPAGIGHLLELRLIEAGCTVTGVAVHVPHYLSDAEYPGAAVAALEHLGTAAKLMLPTDRLREANREMEANIATQVQGSEEVRLLVERLEAQYDVHHQEKPVRSLLAGHSKEDVDHMVEDIEAYLADRPQE